MSRLGVRETTYAHITLTHHETCAPRLPMRFDVESGEIFLRKTHWLKRAIVAIGWWCWCGGIRILLNASQSSRRVVEAAEPSKAWNRVLCDRVRKVYVPKISARRREALYNAAVEGKRSEHVQGSHGSQSTGKYYGAAHVCMNAGNHSCMGSESKNERKREYAKPAKSRRQKKKASRSDRLSYTDNVFLRIRYRAKHETCSLHSSRRWQSFHI